MKKMLLFIACLATVLTLSKVMATNAEAAFEYNTQMEQAHQIAETARQMGLPESDPIIVRAKELWNEANDQFIADQEILTTLIVNEGGASDCTPEHKGYIAMVAINRTNCGYGGALTLTDVICQPRQYLPAYATPGSYYWNEARKDPDIYAECFEIAGKALRGEIVCPPDVIYQANFPQSSYGNEIRIYKQFWACGNWTYFCYA